jgi:hypothetical protein
MRAAGIAIALVFAAASIALAQVPPGLPNPDLQNRIPAPLPPPPKPPVINGPLSQGPPPGVYQPPRLNTFSDRTADCLQAGSEQGLRGRKLDAYTRRCAN